MVVPLLETPRLLTAKPAVDTPAAAAMVWKVLASAAVKLDAGAAAMAVTAAVSAEKLATVAASADAGGRTVASHVTTELVWRWRAARPRRAACTVMRIHDAGTPSLAARSAASAFMTAAVAAVPTAAAGTVTVSVSVTVATAVVDGLGDVDGVAVPAVLDDGNIVAATLGELETDGDGEAIALCEIDALNTTLAEAEGVTEVVVVGLMLPLTDGELEALAVGESEMLITILVEAEGVMEDVFVGLMLPLTDGELEAAGEALAVGEIDALASTLTEAEGVMEDVVVGLMLPLTDGELEAAGETLAVGEIDALATTLAEAEGVTDVVVVGLMLPLALLLGEEEGRVFGLSVGEEVTVPATLAVGVRLRPLVGDMDEDGEVVGVTDGEPLTLAVRDGEALTVGFVDALGDALRLTLADTDGEGVTDSTTKQSAGMALTDAKLACAWQIAGIDGLLVKVMKLSAGFCAGVRRPSGSEERPLLFRFRDCSAARLAKLVASPAGVSWLNCR